MDAVWVFNGNRGDFPSGVFSTREKAEAWIAAHKLSGCLTKYPLDTGVYEWVIAHGYWQPTRPHQSEPGFIQQFSSAHLEHYHYEAGVAPSQDPRGEGGVNVLWVENHAEFARLAVRQFLAGHAVTVVPSLAAARALLAASRFEVLLVDFDLDDGKGTELVVSLQESPRRPIIVATSAHDEGNRALLEAGADAACNKLGFARIPVLIEELRARQCP